MSDYLDDRRLSWAAVGMLAYIHGRLSGDGFDISDLLSAARDYQHWHPSATDRETETALNELLALGYVEAVSDTTYALGEPC